MNRLELLDPGGREPGDVVALRDLLRALDGGGAGIRCPRCRWRPRKDDRWACDCGTAWNTFETGALCPGCGKQWKWTACLACHAWSRHADWYETSCPSSSR